MQKQTDSFFVLCSCFQCGEGPAPGTGEAGPGPDVLAGRREGSGPSGWWGGAALWGACQSKYRTIFDCFSCHTICVVDKVQGCCAIALYSGDISSIVWLIKFL